MSLKLFNSLKSVSFTMVRTLAAAKPGGIGGGKLGGGIGNENEVQVEINFSKLDVRVGRIVSCENHPEANNLFVEKIDLGEENHRTVCSGLASHFNPDEPSKFRGILSEAMLLCASNDTKVELLNPPENVNVGEKVVVEGCDGEPAKEINKKNKIFDIIAVDLQTDENCVAQYKQKPLVIRDKGFIACKSLKNARVK